MTAALGAFSAHLEDLHSLLGRDPGGTSPKETILSLENMMRESVGDQLSGLSSQLFHTERGLLAAMKGSIDASDRNSGTLRELREAAFRTLEWCIEEYVDRLERPALIGEYALPMADVCCYIFRRENFNRVRELAIHVLAAVVRDLREHTPDPRALSEHLFPAERSASGRRELAAVDTFWNALCGSEGSKLSPSVRGACMKMLGLLARAFPEEVRGEQIFKGGSRSQLYRLCAGVLRRETCEPKNPKAPELVGALEALDGLMTESELNPDDVGMVLDRTQACLNLVVVNELKKFAAPRAALHLLGRNMAVFAAESGASTTTGSPADSLLLDRAEVLWGLMLPLSRHDNNYMRPLAQGVLWEFVHVLAAQTRDGARRPARACPALWWRGDHSPPAPRSRCGARNVATGTRASDLRPLPARDQRHDGGCRG